MALVTYDYDSNSEEEEEEEEENTNSSTVIIPSKNSELGSEVNKNTISPKKENKIEENGILTESSLFSNLPESKSTDKEIVEDQIEDFIPKSQSLKAEKQKVKITIPSLSEFKDLDDDETEAKKFKLSTKSSGLISLLPPVKGAVKSATSFVPKVITDKTKTLTPTNSFVPHSVRNNRNTKKDVVKQKDKQKAKAVLSDTESDDDLDIPESFDDEMWEKLCGRPKQKPVIQDTVNEPPEETLNIAPEPEKPYEGLDNKAFKELVGKSKRPLGNIKLIDINEEEILADKDLWMAKSLTDPEMAPKATIEDPVDPTRRRKHHITYLAQQAKANEQDLKNAWAVSKNNRNASRSKYGF